MKKVKLSLNELRVKSFITTLEIDEIQTIGGGIKRRIFGLIDVEFNASVKAFCKVTPVGLKPASPVAEKIEEKVKEQHKKNVTSFRDMIRTMGRLTR